MASSQAIPISLELHESEISKPAPLRILKRSQTVACCSTPRTIVMGGRGVSAESDESKGSPPIGPDRPLTVRKVRKGRGSILVGSLDAGPLEQSPGSAISDLIKKSSHSLEDDPDATPKARQDAARQTSAGRYLQSEYHRRSSEMNISSDSMRSQRDFVGPFTTVDFPVQNNYKIADGSPKIPERRPSKSKNFFLKAFGGGSSEESKRIRRVDSKNSNKNSLIRRLSRGQNSSSSTIPESLSSVEMHVLGTEGQDVTELSIDSRFSSYHELPPLSPTSLSYVTPTANVLVLSPLIIVTPEITSVDTAGCYLWAAIEIKGVLRKADGSEAPSNIFQTSNGQLSDIGSFGHLSAMRIDLVPGKDCIVSEIAGDLYERKTIYVNDTHLILVKVRLGEFKQPSHTKEFSDELIADLESHLGNTHTSYLTVRLTYKHSGFQDHTARSVDGVLPQTTQLRTEAKAVIKRHNSQSAWSPRASRNINGPLGVNPLIYLIEKHFTTEQAREAMRRLADDRLKIPRAKRPSDEMDLNGILGGSIAERRDISSKMASTVSTESISSRDTTLENPQSYGSSKRVSPKTIARDKVPEDDNLPEMDPARRIWTQMRITSGGGRRRHVRSSLSDGHYFDPNTSDDCGPSRLSSDQGSNGPYRLSSTPHREEQEEQAVAYKRNKIMELAVRNKRSVGQDTLRSIAPSTVSGKVKGGTISAVGFGVRSWNWGPPWW